MGYWHEAPLPRDQIVLIATTLGDRIPDDHPVRLFCEILSNLDWSAWENHYCQVAGQPAIPPMIVAGTILYGLSHGIRSSRRLEWACSNAVDFIWLAEGRNIDHSTFCNFRTRFGRELKDLFRQIGRVAMGMGLIRLHQVGLDGTYVRANSSRHATASAKTLQERLETLDKQIEEIFAQAEKVDQQDQDLFGEAYTPNTLPRELSDLKRRQIALQKALAAAERMDAKRSKGKAAPKKASKVPVADADSAILPNKEGGYAPNYLPVAAVDGERGFLLDADVPGDHSEPGTVLSTVDHIEADFEKLPGQMLADSNFATGGNLTGLENRGIEAFMPVESGKASEKNPANRADPHEPVPECDWPKLPRRPQTHKLDRSAFVYDAASDVYWCPMGQPLGLFQTKVKGRDTCEDSIYRVYRCTACVGCPLAGECLVKGTKFRSVSRDQHEEVRERVAARCRSETGCKTYARRSWIAETPYAVIKGRWGFRQFLLRGLEKVRTEWSWLCTAYNLHKLVRLWEMLASAGLRPA